MTHCLLMLVVLAAAALSPADKPNVYVVHRDRAACEMLSKFIGSCTQQVQVFISTKDVRSEAFKVVLNYSQGGTPDAATRIVPVNVVQGVAHAGAIFPTEDATIRSVLVVPLISGEQSVLIDQTK